MVKRILQPSKQSFFLLGPRGTGKTTWLRKLFPTAYFVNLLSEETYQRFLANPGLFAAEVNSVRDNRWVVVDEIQRLPGLLNEVHRFIEERKMRFVLCGSSARKLKRAGVNLLAGRAVNRAMHPFVPEELGARFNLEDALSHGLLPLVLDSEDRQDTLAAYTRMYLKEEIQAEALVRNLPGFARFLPVAALLHGQSVNISNVAREAGVARTTVAGYFSILEETLLGYYLPAYEAKLRVRERKSPKWYWSDPGIVRAMKQAHGPLVAEERGALFEGLVAQVIRAYRDYRGVYDSIFYWSTVKHSPVEVDFLLCRGREFCAVEVKSGRVFDEHWCRGLRAITGLDGLRRRLLVYPAGPELRTADGIEVLPFDLFCRLLAENTLWP